MKLHFVNLPHAGIIKDSQTTFSLQLPSHALISSEVRDKPELISVVDRMYPLGPVQV